MRDFDDTKRAIVGKDIDQGGIMRFDKGMLSDIENEWVKNNRCD